MIRGPLKALEAILERELPLLQEGEVYARIEPIFRKRDELLRMAREEGTPFFLFTPAVLRGRAALFLSAFRSRIPDFEACLAVKSNNAPAVARTATESGLGLDVSSGLELSMALSLGCERILFSGPGKSDDELTLAAQNPDRVTVLMDSFAESERLERAAARAGVKMRAGVRLTTEEHGLWRKFGIPLSRLAEFLSRAGRLDHVYVEGLQFHTSWNLTPGAQVEFIARLGSALAGIPSDLLRNLNFLDMGGGYWPEMGEWLRPAGTERGRLLAAAGRPEAPQVRYRLPAEPIEAFAEAAGKALEEHIFPHVRLRILAEPGRWIVSDAMSILLTVVDRKADDLVVVDGGINMVGWERYEHDYFPLLNLTRPSMTERACLVCGSLCTPHDIWGEGVYGEGVEAGDVLCVPWQGAYTYSLRQEFIKPLPKIVILEG